MNPVKLFISYAHEDEAFKDALVRHLSGLQRLGMIDAWDDRKIDPGQEWEQEIRQSLEQAEIVVFLVSSYFMASDYIYDVEIKNALERYKSDKQVIIPVLTRPCDFSSLPLSEFQALPNHALAVTKWDNQEEAWHNVTIGIKEVIYKLRGESLPAEEDIGTSETGLSGSTKVTLHDFHRYTCNRREQFSIFEENYELKQNNKTRFYYVIGEEEEAHFGLVNRLAHEKGGYLLDIDNPSPQTSNLFIDNILLENLSGLPHLKKRLLRELFARLGIAVNSCEPILDKDLTFVCTSSPIVKKMTGSDYISVLLSIYEDEWDEEEIPALIKWFVTEFCGVALPDNAPTFLFFVGIIYDEHDPEIIQSVNKVVAQSTLIEKGLIKPLPELSVVTKIDITRWFRRYKIIAPDSEVRESYMNKYFPDVETLKMESVQIELQKIIDQFNKE